MVPGDDRVAVPEVEVVRLAVDEAGTHTHAVALVELRLLFLLSAQNSRL